MTCDAVALRVKGVASQMEEFTALFNGVYLQRNPATQVCSVFLHHLQGNVKDLIILVIGGLMFAPVVVADSVRNLFYGTTRSNKYHRWDSMICQPRPTLWLLLYM